MDLQFTIYDLRFEAKFVFSILLFFICGIGFTQSISKGDKLMGDYKYAQAITEYKPFADQGNDKAIRAIAECYRKINDWENAEKYYALLVKMNNIIPKYFLYYGQSLLSNGKYDEAKSWLKKFIDSKPEDQNIVALAKTLLESCDKAKESITPKRNIAYKNLEELNSAASDFCAIPIGNDIYFSSAREGKTDAWTGTGFLQVYLAEWQADSTYVIEPLKGVINSKYYNSGPATIDALGKNIYFTKNNFQYGEAVINKKGDVTLKIFGAKLNKNETHDIHELEFNDVEYSCAYPSINKEGDKIYYTSDRAGGYGGKDIYYSTFTGGKWSKPKNAGNKINTAGDERFPFIAGDGTLYFSSNGWQGLGGLDIFKSSLNKLGEYQTPENLGIPINSSKDDFGFYLDENYSHGFFSSDRAGGKGLDDIYSFEYLDVTMQLNIYGNGSLVNGATVTIEEPGLEPVFLSADKGQLSLVLNTNSAYSLEISKEGFVPNKISINTANDHKPIVKNITLVPN